MIKLPKGSKTLDFPFLFRHVDLQHRAYHLLLPRVPGLVGSELRGEMDEDTWGVTDVRNAVDLALRGQSFERRLG